MSRDESGDGRDTGTALALAALVFVGLGLLALFLIVIPMSLTKLALVPLGILFLGAFHYLVWGRWLSSKLGDEHRGGDEE